MAPESFSYLVLPFSFGFSSYKSLFCYFSRNCLVRFRDGSPVHPGFECHFRVVVSGTSIYKRKHQTKRLRHKRVAKSPSTMERKEKEREKKIVLIIINQGEYSYVFVCACIRG